MACWTRRLLCLCLLLTVSVHAAVPRLLAAPDCKAGPAECSPLDVAHHPLCDDCTAFVKCAGLARSDVIACPQELLYDVVLGVCQFPDLAVTVCRDQASATSKTSPTSPTTTSTTSVTSPTSPTSTTTTPTPSSTASAVSRIPGCVERCADVAVMSAYPSCDGCEYYMLCFGLPQWRERQNCPRGQTWDNSVTRCRADSATCPL